MLVVSDVDDVFLPKPTDLLVNLHEARAGVESILSRINEMFAENLTVGSALGPALQAGSKLIVGLSPIRLRSVDLKCFCCSVAHRRKDHCPHRELTQYRRRGTQESGGSQDSRDVEGLHPGLFIHSRPAVLNQCSRSPTCCSRRPRSTRPSRSNVLARWYPWICSCSAVHTKTLLLSV